MFSTETKEWIEEGFLREMDYLKTKANGYYAKKIMDILNRCTLDEQYIMKYYFSSMPYGDIADVDYEVLKRYASHTVFLRKEVAWCKQIPERTFLLDVAAYRINKEKAMDCREQFYRELMPRVAHMTMKEAALEINYWCAEHAIYQSTDGRTACAWTVYQSGYGRCGEEAVFGVTVFRSLGIPARQVYAPLWAHCDDNHAWVEVWCDGEWYFLGACEPDAVLNKGWFTGAASRAMVLYSKYFTALPMEDADYSSGFAHYINRTSMYAKTTPFEVEIVDEKGVPLKGLTVLFELLNYSFYGTIARKKTDAQGRASIDFGYGDLQVHVTDGVCWMDCKVNTGSGFVRLVFKQQSIDEIWKESLIQAPDFSVIHPGIVTQQQNEQNKQRNAMADTCRRNRMDTFFDAARAEQYPEVSKLLREAGGNFNEVYQFVSKDDNPYRIKLLQALSVKDMADLQAEVLEEHLQAAMPFEGRYPEEIFVKNLMNPRIELEELSCYRKFIQSYFTDAQKESFLQNPGSIWDYIEANIKEDENRNFENLKIIPSGALQIGMASMPGKQILFCAICRTLGIPAKINMRDREATYYKDGIFISVGKKEEITKDASVILHFDKNTEWRYFGGWSFSVLKEGSFYPLGLFRTPICDNKMELPLASGVYRLLTNIRMPNGNQVVRETVFSLASGEEKQFYVEKHQIKEEELLIDKTAMPVSIAEEGEGKELPMSDNKRQIVLWLEPGKEPTQHVLNELKENRIRCEAFADQIAIIFQSEQDCKEKTCAETLQTIPGLSWHLASEWKDSELISQSLNLQPYQYPLVYVRDAKDHVIYASCGYNVGAVDFMLKLLS